MAADQVFSSKLKYAGLFNFKQFYEFCYTWLIAETGMEVIAEEEYVEKLSGPVKNIDIKWKGSKKVTDYFKFEIKVEFKLLAISEVEMNQGGKKIKTNKGEIGIKVKGLLHKDYEGKFDVSPTMRMWRAIYEKWIIPQRVKALEDKLAGDCDIFLGQAKAFLDIIGRR
jgi:hypothetical protein